VETTASFAETIKGCRKSEFRCRVVHYIRNKSTLDEPFQHSRMFLPSDSSDSRRHWREKNADAADSTSTTARGVLSLKMTLIGRIPSLSE
jgi:hypothetical protein